MLRLVAQVERGTLKTDNFRMNGASAAVLMSGTLIAEEAWAPRLLDSYRPSRRDVLSTHTFDGRLPVDTRLGRLGPERWAKLGSCAR